VWLGGRLKMMRWQLVVGVDVCAMIDDITCFGWTI